MMKKSITTKLRKLLTVNAVIIVLVAISALTIFELVTLKSRAVNGLATIADIFASNTTAAIVFDDKAAITEILGTLKEVNRIYAGYIIDKEGKILSQYSRLDASKESINNAANQISEFKKLNKRYHFDFNGLQYYKPIMFHGEKIGTIYLFDNLSWLQQRAYSYLFISLVLLLLTWVLSFLLAEKQQLVFTKPILALKKAMDQVTKNNNYTVQVPISSEDEIGDLIIGFNEMITEIDRRGIALKKNHEMEEEKRKEHVQKLEEARLRAEELSHAKSLFVANMSHEIRTPMNGMMGVIELLGKSNLSEKQKEFVQIAKDSSATLLAIINDILDFSKIEAKQIKLESLPIDLRKIVELTTIQFNVQAYKKGIELLCNYPPDFHSSYFGDELRIKQILYNLISNGIKFTQVGQVEIGIEKILPVDKETDRLHLYVKDTGFGIKSESIKQIFEPFLQGDNSTTRKFGGTGLGLSICKNMIDMMSGKLEVESIPGKGSNFKFMIELKRNKQISSVSHTKLEFENHIALIVDDNLINCQIVSAYLNSFGIENKFVTNATDAIPLLHDSYKDKKGFDIVILDHHMTGIDGIELAEKIRNEYTKKQVTIILLSSIDNDLYSKKSTLNLIFNSFLVKPVSAEKLLLSIKNALCEREGETYSVQSNEIVKEDDFQSVFNCSVLVAEDYEVNQRVIKMMLENLGCEVTLASQGEEAFNLYLHNDFDMVFMDCQMPILDGYDATKKIRIYEKKMQKRTPIVALTANVSKEDKEKCMAAGMDYFVTKPFSEKDLIFCLKKFSKSKKVKKIESCESDKAIDEEVDIILDGEQLQKLFEMSKDKNSSKDIINLFLNSTPEKIKIILLALENKNYDEIRRVTHMLKSSSAMLGAKKLSNNLKEIEQQIQQNEYDEIYFKCQNLAAVFQETSLRLQKYA